MTGRLIVVSNRIPTDAEPAGGLVFALHEALVKQGGIWVGSLPDPTDTPGDQLQPLPSHENYERLSFSLTPDDHANFYLGFSNSVLWPVCHRRGDLVRLDRNFEEGYVHVNTRLARQISEILRPDDMIWIHDYHFFPLADQLRKLGHGGKIGFFLHIPFPALGDLGALPPQADLARWLAQYDLIGLQTRLDVARCLEMFRANKDAEFMVDGSVKYGERQIELRSFPIGIDVDAFSQAAAVPLDKDKLPSDLPRDLVIGVDRLDYSKGLPNRFRAFGRYLEKRTETSPRATLLQIAPPTREEVPAYRQIRIELEELAGRLNGDHAELDWMPLRYIHRSIDRKLLAQLYRRARVGLVTPFADGMNLVAKEYIAAQDPVDPGVLILSRMAGAAEDMQDALLVNPYDVEEMSEAIAEAFDMPLQERKRRYDACMENVRATDVSRWSEKFISTLAACDSTLVWQ